MSDGGLKSMTISLRLLREGRTIDSAFRADHELREVRADGGWLFIGQGPTTPPLWAPFIGQFALGSAPVLATQSCAAVLFVNVTTDDAPTVTRTMALAFGTGHHALDPDAFERGFGLRVALNSVARSSLRTLDMATLDATTFLRRVQASRDADLVGFGIDIDRDLLTLVAGRPRDLAFARSLAGRDALTLNTRTSSSDVQEKCKKALSLYRAQDYKKEFAFIDYIRPVRQRDLLAQLDALAFAQLRTLVDGGSSDLHVALPDILDPDESVEIGYYGLGLRSGTKRRMRSLPSRTTSLSCRRATSVRFLIWQHYRRVTRFALSLMARATRNVSEKYMNASCSKPITKAQRTCYSVATGSQSIGPSTPPSKPASTSLWQPSPLWIQLGRRTSARLSLS